MLLPLLLALTPQASYFELESTTHWDGLGMKVFYLDDINGDGVCEIGTSAFCTEDPGLPLQYNAGSVQIFDGATRQLIRRHDGVGEQARLGEYAQTVGDVDGDGYIDYAAGARNESFSGTRRGSVHVWSGLTGVELHRFDGHKTDADFGFAFSNIGDIDGDGYEDIAIGARNEDNNRGSVRFYSGRTGQRWAKRRGNQVGERFGWSIASAGDVDLDGVPDIAVGSPFADNQRGKVSILSGATFDRIQEYTGGRNEARLGASLFSATDINGDGDPELFIGEPCFDSLYIYSVQSGVLMRQHHGRLNPTKEGFGHSFAVCGDVDGDGCNDYIVGLAGEWDVIAFVFGAPGGSVIIYSGKTGDPLLVVHAEELDDAFGQSVAMRPDAHGPGQHGILIGAPAAGDLIGDYAPGKVYGAYLDVVE